MVLTAAADRRRFLRPLTLTAVMFFTVSGGPYGLEPLFSYVGGAQALVLVLLLPFLWSLPAIMVVLELNGLMPVNGGYYLWVKTALGPFWGFLEGWWSWIFTLVDLAIYPVLFLQYLSFFVPDIEPLRIPLSLRLGDTVASGRKQRIAPDHRKRVLYRDANRRRLGRRPSRCQPVITSCRRVVPSCSAAVCEERQPLKRTPARPFCAVPGSCSHS